jgi:hypothetical protein
LIQARQLRFRLKGLCSLDQFLFDPVNTLEWERIHCYEAAVKASGALTFSEQLDTMGTLLKQLTYSQQF